MDVLEQRGVLERFLNHHGIHLLPTSRLSHFGRRFSMYFPAIANHVNPQGLNWGRVVVAALADHVATLNAANFTKVGEAKPVHTPKKQKRISQTRQFLLSWEWRRVRYEVLRDRGKRCECCGATSEHERIEVDHIKPISKFWHLRLEKSNLQVLCRPCNKGKGNRHIDDHRKVRAA